MAESPENRRSSSSSSNSDEGSVTIGQGIGAGTEGKESESRAAAGGSLNNGDSDSSGCLNCFLSNEIRLSLTYFLNGILQSFLLPLFICAYM